MLQRYSRKFIFLVFFTLVLFSPGVLFAEPLHIGLGGEFSIGVGTNRMLAPAAHLKILWGDYGLYSSFAVLLAQSKLSTADPTLRTVAYRIAVGTDLAFPVSRHIRLTFAPGLLISLQSNGVPAFGLTLPLGARIIPIPRLHINICYAFIEEDFLLRPEEKYFGTREISIGISILLGKFPPPSSNPLPLPMRNKTRNTHHRHRR